jgi:predicted kinase
VLIVFSGLPGAGKTTVAGQLARTLAAVYLRIDSIEQALRHRGVDVSSHGYDVAYALALDNLRHGRTVVADCVNPVPLTRHAWHAVGLAAGVRTIDVEVVCSDAAEHRRRVEGRLADIPGHKLPNWEEVVAREYEPWDSDQMRVDTACFDPASAAEFITDAIRARGTLRP